MASEVEVCVSDYLAAEDLGGKLVTVQIEAIRKAPDLGRPTKSVEIQFAKAKKKWICNVTNQWSIAVLLESKQAKDWIGKRITLCTDEDVDVSTGQPVPCVRVGGSPDASEEANKRYVLAWTSGPRKRGELAKRLKRAFRQGAMSHGQLGRDEG